MGCSYTTKITSVGVLGVLLGGSGTALIFIFQAILHSEINELVPLANGSDSYQQWQDPSFPIYMQYYIINVDNPDEVKSGQKPILTEHGPYTYLEVNTKDEIKWNENGTVSYKNPKSYVFLPEKSVGPDTEKFTILNIPLVVIGSMLKDEPLIAREFVSALLERWHEKLFKQLSPHDILWGYPDTIFAGYNKYKKYLPKKYRNLPIPPLFGIFYGQNSTDDGLYTVYTGKGDVSKFTYINKWNGTSELSYWNSSQANMINGTDGTTYHPFVEKTDVLPLFSTDLCRSIYVVFEKEVVVNGVPSYQFTVPAEVFQNGSKNPANMGFCTTEPCLDDGLLDVNACQGGAPIVLSSPHFYLAAQHYIDSVVGMDPVKEQHQTILTMEPITGAVTQAAKRIQINVNVKQIEGVKELASIHDVIFPILWLNESATVDDDTANALISQVITPVRIVTAVQWSLIAVGSLIVVIVILVVTYRCMNQKKEESPLLIVDEDEGNIQA